MRFAFMGDGSLGHVKRWVGFFRDRGHDVLLLSFESVKGCEFPARLIKKHLPTDLLGYLSALSTVRRELTLFEPDLVNAIYAGGYGLIGALSGRRPLVVSALGSDLLVDYPSSIVHRIQIRHAIRKADLVTTDAENLSRIAVSIGARPERVIKAFFGIDEKVFFPSTPGAGVSGRRESPHRIVSTRQLFEIYNIDLLIEAAPIVLDEKDALFVICSDGPERERLEELALKKGVRGNFSFKGRIPTADISSELRSADVYVSASRSDSTSVSLLEAMACGVPPVVTNLEANREWITDGENGILFEPGDSESLAGAIIRLIEDREFAASARERNLELVRERALWKPNMERVENAFISLVRGT